MAAVSVLDALRNGKTTLPASNMGDLSFFLVLDELCARLLHSQTFWFV